MSTICPRWRNTHSTDNIINTNNIDVVVVRNIKIAVVKMRNIKGYRVLEI